MADAERERQAVARGAAQQVEDARAEAEALRRLVKLKARELKNIRRLAQVHRGLLVPRMCVWLGPHIHGSCT